MGTVQSKGYNPNISDTNDPRYTALSQHSDRMLMANLFGEGDVYAGRSIQHISVLNLSSNSVGIKDRVYIGNRCGVVVAVQTQSSKVVSITVDEDMRYLPLDYRSNPSSFGYTSKTTRRTTYIFGKNTNIAGNRNGSNVVLHQGSLMVVPYSNDNKSTWNSIAQAVDSFKQKFE